MLADIATRVQACREPCSVRKAFSYTPLDTGWRTSLLSCVLTPGLEIFLILICCRKDGFPFEEVRSYYIDLKLFTKSGLVGTSLIYPMLPSLSSSATQLVHILFVIYSLVPIAHGAITDVFHVKGGTTKGGCDGKNIVGWFADVERLIDSAETGAAATDQDSRKYLQTFFSIGPNDDANQAGGWFLLLVVFSFCTVRVWLCSIRLPFLHLCDSGRV